MAKSAEAQHFGLQERHLPPEISHVGGTAVLPGWSRLNLLEGTELIWGKVMLSKLMLRRTAETVSSWGQPEKATITASLMMRCWLWQATGEHNSRNLTWWYGDEIIVSLQHISGWHAIEGCMHASNPAILLLSTYLK